jgi:parvulin-like peptidyl-prolyl isomerase
LSAHPKLALSAVDLLVFDVLVAHHAQQFGITVEPARIEQLAAAEEAQIREQVKAELGGELDFSGYVWRLFGLRESDWQQTLRLRTAQRLYQGYVIRYLALREDRVQVRFLVHQDQAVVQEVAAKVRAGADFATLALQRSEDPSRRDGGLLPPFGRGFQHPVAAVAFGLAKGEVSTPFQASWGDEQRWFVVYCLDQLPGREVTFAAVRDEIDRDLESRPVSPLETTAYTLRWRGELERSARSDAADR